MEEAEETAKERARLERNASEAMDQFSVALQRHNEAFRELVEFESKHLRDEQADWLSGR